MKASNGDIDAAVAVIKARITQLRAVTADTQERPSIRAIAKAESQSLVRAREAIREVWPAR